MLIYNFEFMDVVVETLNFHNFRSPQLKIHFRLKYFKKNSEKKISRFLRDEDNVIKVQVV